MKNRGILLLLFSIWIGVAQAQYDPKALVVLDAMSAKYSKISSYKAKIKSSMVNEVDGINEEMNGEITVKNDMYRLKIEEQEIYNDGKTVWTFLSEINEVNIDDYYPEDDEITPSKIYTAYKKGYKYVLIEENTLNGVKCDVVDLVAENVKSTQFFKIRMFISQKDRSLIGWTMFEKSGSQYKYTIENFQENIKVEDSYFKFNPAKHPGVEIVDLR